MDMRKVGSFYITDTALQELTPDAELILKKLLGTVFITSAVHNYGYGRFEYIGFCEDFDVVEQGQCALHYVVEIKDGKCKFIKR